MEKSASIFRFKRFSVVNERSAMKVNTDGVLLGAVMTLFPEDRRLLDIGTGTGTISLMAAQRMADICPSEKCCVDAIDIDEASASEADANFRNSPWGDVLHAYHVSLEEFVSQAKPGGYDLIFSNPPYFDNALQAPEERRNAARHTSTGLSYREILDFAAQSLSPAGRVALVLPADTEHDLTRYARMSGLYSYKITRVRTVARKAPSRIIAEFSRNRTDSPQERVLTIQEGGRYTQEYLAVMKDFYLFAC